ncbi:MAG: XRE family transcriptional regulator [Butyrivibrio sp.]|nr:XRE family transcriptional regulator [Butyrivibrio sp.]
MRVDKQIKILAVKTDTTVAEIGRRLDKSPQAFSQKCKRDNFTISELQDIAMVTGCRLECAFVMPSGERIELGD